MADMLATAEDLAAALQQDVDTASATLAIERATATVQQAAGGQRIIQIVGDILASREGECGRYLTLPQIPVTEVTEVRIGGVVVTDWTLVGSRLRRRCGWWSATGRWCLEPEMLQVTYTHGYPPGSQDLQLARDAVLSLCVPAYGNPQMNTSRSIDDFTQAWAEAVARAELTDATARAIRRKYGRPAGLVPMGVG